MTKQGNYTRSPTRKMGKQFLFKEKPVIEGNSVFLPLQIRKDFFVLD